MKFRREDFLILAIVFSLLFPPLPEIGGLTLRLEDILLLGIAPFYCLKGAGIRKDSPLWIFLVFLFFACISTFSGYLFKGVPPVKGDFNEFVRMFKYVFAIIIASSVNKTVFFKKYDKFMRWGGIYVIILSIVEYVNPFNIDTFIGKIYSVPYYHIEGMVEGSRRIVVTGGDPNIGAFIVTYFLIYFYLKTFIEKKYHNVVMILLLFLCVVATSSRTIFFAILFVCGFFVLMDEKIKKGVKFSIILLGCLGVILLFSSQSFQYLTVGINQLTTGDNESLNLRYIIWETNLNYFRESPLLGWGPAKAIHDTIVDGEYVFLLVRYGIIGIGIFLFLLLRNMVLTFRVNGIYGKYISCITILSFFFMVTNNFFSGYQLFLNYIILVTVVLTNRREDHVSLD